MIVVDTSVWIEFFRGREPVTARLRELLDRDEVALAIPVRIELLSGARKTEVARLARLLAALPVLYPSDETWRRVEDWVTAGIDAGQRFGVGDLLIAGLAAEHGFSVWSMDTDFRRMSRLGLISVATP